MLYRLNSSTQELFVYKCDAACMYEIPAHIHPGPCGGSWEGLLSLRKNRPLAVPADLEGDNRRGPTLNE